MKIHESQSQRLPSTSLSKISFKATFGPFRATPFTIESVFNNFMKAKATLKVDFP